MPTESATAKEKVDWAANNAHVTSCLLGAVDLGIALSLRSFSTAHEMWQHLCSLYSQTSASRQFEVSTAIANLSQGDLDVRSYYQSALHLWTEEDMLSLAVTKGQVVPAMLQERKRLRLMQFLAKLRPEFEPVRASLLHRNISSLDDVVAELIREETRLRSQAQVDHGSFSFETAFAVGRTSKPQFQRPVPSHVECHYRREKGHVKIHCRKRNHCNYCKTDGHIVLDCPSLARRGKSGGSRPAAPVPAYGVQLPLPSQPSSAPSAGLLGVCPATASLSSETIEQLVQSALEKVLPSALQSVFSATPPTGTPVSWHLDSAAYNHMSSIHDQFLTLKRAPSLELQVANGSRLPVQGMGTVRQPNLMLSDTLYVPGLVPNLASVGQLFENGCRVIFDSDGCLVQDRSTGRTLGRGSKHGRTYTLDSLQSLESCPSLGNGVMVGAPSAAKNSSSFDSDLHSFSVSLDDWNLWHCRLGHPHAVRLKTMFRNKLLPGVLGSQSAYDTPCVSCIQAKTTQISFGSSDTQYAAAFDLVHTDLWGPPPTTSRMGYRYFALFIDHATRYCWVYFLRKKSELCGIAHEFVQMVRRTQFGKTVKIIRSDPGGEFNSTPLLTFYRQHEILSQLSCPGVSQQNGLVERKHRHVLDLTRALLIHSHVPVGFWVEAVRTVIYLINRQVTPVLNQHSPHFMLFGKHPDYTRLRVFGCRCFVLLTAKERHKLEPKVATCVFIGYSDRQKGYMCYDVVSRRVRISPHVVFMEQILHYKLHSKDPPDLSFLDSLPLATLLEMTTPTQSALPPVSPEPSSPSHSGSSSDDFSTSPEPVTPPTGSSSSSGSLSSSPSSSELDSSPSPSPNPAAPVLRRSNRSNFGQPPLRSQDFVAFSVDALAIPIPTSYRQARGDENWERDMDEEKDALEAQNTWTLVPRPVDQNVVGSRWVYTVKLNPDGTLERFRARVVAQGFKQEFGIDYEDTFAPVAKMQTVRTVLAVAAMQNWPLVQLDVKNAFLHGDLKETIYMERPPGYTKGDSSTVCLLHRSLYGLKQAPRAWFEKFHTTILQAGFVQSANDPSLFTRSTIHGLTVLLIYVNDMIVTGGDSAGIQELTDVLHKAFHLKELGNLAYFLGLEVQRSTHGLFVSQHKYILDLLDHARLSDCKPVVTPMEQNLKLSSTSGDVLSSSDSSLYRSLVGSLIYLTSTRPDVSYAVQIVSQFMSSPRMLHLDAVFRILRYLRGTAEVGLYFPSSGDFSLSAYLDADYVGCLDTRRSTSG
ncbi:unnamed protein product [Linum trigynum]|uniref:Integrase catalytic domain-containing protein n=1 Tax=Linum trigynum TaxID=586398 RepID=A0AAV2D874_9ROSI